MGRKEKGRREDAQDTHTIPKGLSWILRNYAKGLFRFPNGRRANMWLSQMEKEDARMCPGSLPGSSVSSLPRPSVSIQNAEELVSVVSLTHLQGLLKDEEGRNHSQPRMALGSPR